MGNITTLDHAHTHGHTAFLYQTAQERLKLLAEYFKQGLKAHELCIFVTPESEKQVIQDFKEYALDVTSAIKSGALRVFEMEDTYLPHGSFVRNYMLTNVTNFAEDAQREGYRGIRTAGEMSWLNRTPEAVADALDYEQDIDEFAGSNKTFVGMCLYPVHDTDSEVLSGAFNTHASVIFDDDLNVHPSKAIPATG